MIDISFINKARMFHLLSCGDMSLPTDEIIQAVSERYGYDWMNSKPCIDSNNIGFVTQATKYPVPVSYFYSIVMDESFDSKIDKNPGVKNINRVVELFKPSEVKDVSIIYMGRKYLVTMVNRVFSQEFLRGLGLTGEYAVDLNTAILMKDINLNYSNSPYRYTFAVNGRKGYSPLCCLPESLHNSYVNDLSCVSVNTIGVSECFMAMVKMFHNKTSFRFDYHENETSLLVRRNDVYTNKSFSYRECMLDNINKMIYKNIL